MEFYTIHSINMQVSREEVLNHRRFQNGKFNAWRYVPWLLSRKERQSNSR